MKFTVDTKLVDKLVAKPPRCLGVGDQLSEEKLRGQALSHLRMKLLKAACQYLRATKALHTGGDRTTNSGHTLKQEKIQPRYEDQLLVLRTGSSEQGDQWASVVTTR